MGPEEEETGGGSGFRGGVQFGAVGGQALRQFAAVAGWRDDACGLGDACGVSDVEVVVGRVQRVGSVPFVGAQEAVRLGGVNPGEQVWVGRVVRHSLGGRPADAVVDAADVVDGSLGVLRGAVGRHGQEGAGALEAAPRVAAVSGVPGHRRHGEWVQGLQEECADPADEHGGVAVDGADRAVGCEPARARGVMDAGAVRRSVGARDAAEQGLAQLFTDCRHHGRLPLSC